MTSIDTSKIKCICITGDAGEGEAVQHIFTLPKSNEVLSYIAKQLNYQFHALNKCFETGCLKTFGKQGIGQVNIFQTIYVYAKMIKVIKEQFELELVDTIHQIVMEKLMSCESW